ncbi:MAG TPA: hypothetical protein P5105_05780, partial [Victivallales bacterium]|nr:hypothetical protein [Victivallales bacterium]
MDLIPGFIKTDFFRKLTALIFALLVWWKISMQIGTEEIIRNVPVKIVDNISTIALENNSPKTVNLVIKSVAYTRGSISPSDIKININLPV